MTAFSNESNRLLQTVERSVPEQVSTATRRRPPSAVVAAAPVLVGECLDDRHPVVDGRCLVAFADADGPTQQRWLTHLEGVAVRSGDRVLLVQPDNWLEPLIAGIVSRSGPEPQTAADNNRTIVVRNNETVRIAASDGKTLLEIGHNHLRPVVRLAQADVRIDVPGKFHVAAEEISLTAREDVVVNGRTIRLN